MPKVTIEGHGDVDVAVGTRLVNAIEDAGVDIGHRCGGQARCTTCKVEFSAGEPTVIREAEAAKLEEKGLTGECRLACQILVDGDMSLKVLVRGSEMEAWTDTGPRCADELQP
jgi:ferredoxin